MMTTSTAGVALIKEYEGCKLEAYQCSARVWTIGYGHTGADTAKGRVITLEEAEALLKKDLAVYEGAVRTALPNKLRQNQFDALVAFCYNVGVNAFMGSTLARLAGINPDNPYIRAEFMKWINAGGKPSEGLRRRRAAEAKMYFDNL